VRYTERNSACVMSKRTFALSGKSVNDAHESSFSRSNPATNTSSSGGIGPLPGARGMVGSAASFSALAASNQA
jgi:hypothetical protein